MNLEEKRQKSFQIQNKRRKKGKDLEFGTMEGRKIYEFGRKKIEISCFQIRMKEERKKKISSFQIRNERRKKGRDLEFTNLK